MALAEARAAAARGEVPVGAVVLDAAGVVLARAGNEVEARRDASAHAELLALRAAAAVRGDARLPDCELVVTLEPCPMCAQAISLFRIRRLTFGAYVRKAAASSMARACSMRCRAIIDRRLWAAFGKAKRPRCCRVSSRHAGRTEQRSEFPPDGRDGHRRPSARQPMSLRQKPSGQSMTPIAA